MFVSKKRYQKSVEDANNFYKKARELEAADRYNRRVIANALEITALISGDFLPTWNEIMVEIGRLAEGNKVKINKCKKA
jgi:hypothetical protein